MLTQYEENANANVVNRWLHSRRYEYVKSYLQAKYGKRKIRILEIGVGFGKLYAELNKVLNIDYTGIEFLENLYQATQERYQTESNFTILHGSILDAGLQNQLSSSYDVIIALETFEHIHARDLPAALGFLRQKLTFSYLITSVPVEIGLTIFIKNLGSYLLHYSRFKEYSLADTLHAAMYQVHKLAPHSGDNAYPKHKGFDWRVYRYLLHQDYVITVTRHLPLAWLPAHIATNVLFVATPREKIL